MSKLVAEKSLLNQLVSSKYRPIAEKLGDYLITKGDKIVTKEDIAKYIAPIMKKDEITIGDVTRVIVHARAYLEEKKTRTIWNVRGEGYRIATEKEKAIFLLRTARTTIKWASRAQRLHAITDKKLIPEAREYVFGSADKAQEAIELHKQQFSLLFDKLKQKVIA